MDLSYYTDHPDIFGDPFFIFKIKLQYHMESYSTKIKRIIDLKLKILGISSSSKDYNERYQHITGINSMNFDYNNISEYEYRWLMWHIPGGLKMIDEILEAKSTYSSIITKSNQNPLYIDDNKFNRFDIIKAKQHIGEELSEENEYLDINEDGKIDEEDIKLLRKVLETSSSYSGYVKYDDNDIENLIKVYVTASSTNYTITLNGISTKKLLVNENSKISYVIVSGQYEVSGTIDVETDDISKEIVVSEDLDSNSKISTALTLSGEKNLIEDVSISRVAGGIIQSNDTILNLNGHSITANGAKYAVLLVRGTATYEINGEGIIEDTSTESGGVIWTSSETCKVVINGGTFIANTISSQCIYCEKGTIEITGGTFKSAISSPTYLLNCYDSNYKSGKANIIITGGKFYNFDPSNNKAEGEGTNFVADGYSVTSYDDEEGNVIYEVIRNEK